MRGYKYISMGTGCDGNFEVYLEKAHSGSVLHYSELKEDARGQYDPEECVGIYFCDTFDNLSKWINDLFDWTPVDALEVVEIEPIGEIVKRNYENGSTSYVVENCKVRLLPDNEYPCDLLKTIVDYFERS